MMTSFLKDQFGEAISELKMKNIDEASLHEIIGEFAPLIGMDLEEALCLKSINGSSPAVVNDSETNLTNGSPDSVPVVNGHFNNTSPTQAAPETSRGLNGLDMSFQPTEPDFIHSNFTEGASDSAAVIDYFKSTLTNPNKQLGDMSSFEFSNLKQEWYTEIQSDSNLKDIIDASLKSMFETKTYHELQYYQCKVCPKIFDTKYHLQRHLLSHAGNRPHKCQLCDKSFSQKCDLNRHMNVHNSVRKYACSVCNKTFKRADYLTKHERQYCGVQKPFKCAKCSKGFEDLDQLHDHLRTHTESSFICEHCSEEFTTVDGLVQHRKTHSKTDEEYDCTKCGQHFTDFNSYVDHFKAHSGDRPYTCDLCHKVFSRNHNLMTHMWIHNQEKQHTCTICAKTFTYYSNLQVHLRVHRNERPYKCDECEKGFLTSSDLRRHKRTHSGEKPYKCTQCSAMYARKERLISHMVTHIEAGMDEREPLQGSAPVNGDIMEEDNSNTVEGEAEKGEVMIC